MRRSTKFLAVGLTVALLGVSVLYGGPRAHAASQKTLLFGTALSLTGATSNEGHLTLEGYQIWVKEVNAHGGIKVGSTTYKVALKYYDDASNPTQSAQLYEQLVSSDHVNLLLGPYGTSATLQDEAIAEEHNIPMVEGNGAANSIFARGFKYIFGVLSPAVQYANVMMQAALSLKSPPHSVAIINANDAFSSEVASNAKDYATTHHLNVVEFQSYPANATDLTNVLTPLKSNTPDMILGSGHVNEAVVTMKQLRQLGINATLYPSTVRPPPPDSIPALARDATAVSGSAPCTSPAESNGLDLLQTSATLHQLSP